MTNTTKELIGNAVRALKAQGVELLEIAEFLTCEMGGWEPPNETVLPLNSAEEDLFTTKQTQ